ncbi:Transposon Tf2-12 polyprotein [Sesamum angolense]|uniref:Transposon Tf2-12 polyprotein n=1 Tax=Sesamum angolense TaxID=2727404 RepID=A0AAE2BHJ8_9LAMI|nr:Transposon Tf2-12 polyprotein [Sesamum angolense]
MQLARQGNISLEEDSVAINTITIESGHVDGNKDSCNAMHGDNITSNEDTLFRKEDSSDADDCMSTFTVTDEDLLLGSKPHNRPLFVAGYVLKKVLDDNKPFTETEPHFADAKYYFEDVEKGKEVLPPEEPKSYNNQNTRKNDSSTLEVKLSKGLTLPLTRINMKQPSKPPLKGFVLSNQKREGGHVALAINEKEFDPKALKLLIKAGYDPIEKLSLGLGFTPPKPVPIAIKRVNNNYVSEGFSSTEDHKRVLKAKAQIVIFTQLQSDDEDDKESVVLSNYISNSAEENIAQTYHITLIEYGEVEEEDAEDASTELEEGIKATIDELKKVNLRDIENPRPIYISTSLTQEEEGTYITLLHEFKDVFAWSYKKMPGLDPKVVVHHLSVSKGARPVKQGQRRFRSELIPLIEGEVNKLNEVSFIREAPADEELTAFRTPKGIYCYKVMPFELKNAGTTYQRAMQQIFDDMLDKNVECYIDDLVVKSNKRENHFHDLKKLFECLRRYQLKMNPSKCAFGVTSGKFLGFIIRQRGIEIEQARIDAILRIPEPRNIHELKSLQ